MKRIIKEQLPSILELELNRGQHAKLALEMKTIVEEVSQKLLQAHVYQAFMDKLSKDVGDKMTEIDKYLKETNEHKAKKLEETLTEIMKNQKVSA